MINLETQTKTETTKVAVKEQKSVYQRPPYSPTQNIMNENMRHQCRVLLNYEDLTDLDHQPSGSSFETV